MLYMCLIGYDPSIPPEGNLQPKHAELESELRGQGKFVGGAGLMPIAMGTSKRIKNGRPVVTDGPFPETKEALGGYYIIECATDAEAIAIAARIPVDKNSWIDVRPIFLWHPNNAHPANATSFP